MSRLSTPGSQPSRGMGTSTCPDEVVHSVPLIIENLTLVRFLYAVFLAVDANFKHKSRLRVTKAKLLAQKAQAAAAAQGLPEVEEVIDAKDVALGPGWGCFVDNGPYMEHLRAQPDQNEAGYFLDLIILC